MMLSDALLNGAIHFRIDRSGEKVRYQKFQFAVQDAFPDASPDTFPLAFACPLFYASQKSPKCIWDRLPLDAQPSRPGIYFLCDVIDCLAVAHGWNEARVGCLIRHLEDALTQDGRNMEGQRPDAATSNSVCNGVEPLDSGGAVLENRK